MTDIAEGVGTAVEGGLFARAVAGKSNQATTLSKGHFAEGACLNCGTELIGDHCHSCGQQAHLHRTLSAFMHDLLHGALHFDGKTWRTLPLLIGKPGELTRRYIDGQRKRFVSPMALFLFCIFLMFAVFQIAGISAPVDIPGDTDAQLQELTAEQQSELLERRDLFASRVDDPEISETRRERAQESLADVERQLDALVKARSELPFLGDPNVGARPAVAAEAPREGNGWEGELESVPWIQTAVKKWRMNPGLMLYKLQTNFYKFSWLLIPLSIPFVPRNLRHLLAELHDAVHPGDCAGGSRRCGRLDHDTVVDLHPTGPHLQAFAWDLPAIALLGAMATDGAQRRDRVHPPDVHRPSGAARALLAETGAATKTFSLK